MSHRIPRGSWRRHGATLALTTLVTGLLAGVTTTAPASSAPASLASAEPGAALPPSEATLASGLVVENSYVDDVGWVKPDDGADNDHQYVSRILLTNPTAAAIENVSVRVSAPVGTDFVAATPVPAGTGAATLDSADAVSWTGVSVPAGATRFLVLHHEADSLTETPTLVWRDLSSTASVSVGTTSTDVRAHGPRVIPPGDAWNTARYGDRPFPVVPVAYTDREYQADNSGGELDRIINDPAFEGSTFNLFQEMSLGQLFPEGTVPSAGLDGTDFTGVTMEEFSHYTPPTEGSSTCTGVTFADTPVPEEGTPLYPERITNGVYQLPGSTGYYGQDGNVSAVPGAVAGVGALMQIDNGCGPTGKLVYDAAVVADPEIDYSDYDTDKDGVVDFFMVVFAGCGGNGSSQLSTPGDPAGFCPFGDVSNDNVWPHSSSLEYYYTDAQTGLPGYTTKDQLKDHQGRRLYWTDESRSEMTTHNTGLRVYVRVGPYNVNPESAIEAASVISHEYGHSLGLPDFYSLGGRDTYGDWNLMATDKSQNMDVFSRQELGWIVPEVLEPGQTRQLDGWTESKLDTHTIHWQTPDGTPYTLSGPTVHNAEAYVAKLPGRVLLSPDRMDDGEGASASHTWWSGSGNDFGCVLDGKGRNIDLAVPELRDLPAGSTVDLSFKSMFDIEWDYDYGYVLSSKDGGQTWASNASERTLPTTTGTNPNQNACQGALGNGITGSSASYSGNANEVTLTADRTLGEYPQSTWLTDTFDVSELAGASLPVLRFSYATDPGLARPGWFIDDVKVTATLPDGTTRDLFVTDFESTGGPDDPHVYNGGCKDDTPSGAACTKGWTYVDAGSEAPNDHAYYMELRNRSGFDFDGKGQVDRDPIGFEPGLSLVYTDEAHGYGNVGTDNPPAQSPIDSRPEPGSDTPDLNDAAWTTADFRNRFSDWGTGHVDNYTDPSREDEAWRFDFDCLRFVVQEMARAPWTGTEAPAVGSLTADVEVFTGDGCAEFDYGYGEAPAAPQNTAPTAAATATPQQPDTRTEVTFDAGGSTDAETPDSLSYAWDFGDGGQVKDATGEVVGHTFPHAGTYDVTLTVTDPEGLTDTATVTVTVTKPPNGKPTARMSAPDSPMDRKRVTLSAAGSSDPETDAADLTYTWDFGDGGSAVDAEGPVVRTRLREAGPRTITLTVTDPEGATDTASERVVVRREIVCSSDEVRESGSWRTVRDDRAPGDSYCDNLGRGSGKDVLRTTFRGDQVDVWHGTARDGGVAIVRIDGERVGKLRFGADHRLRMNAHRVFDGLGGGRHTLELVVKRGRAYVDGFVVTR